MQDATLLLMLNTIGAACTALLAFSLFQIPQPGSSGAKGALRYLRFAVVTWAFAFSAGSIQVLTQELPELRLLSVLLANLGYASSYFFICVAISRRYSSYVLRIRSWQFILLLTVTAVTALLLIDQFMLRNLVMPQLHTLLLVTALLMMNRSQKSFHQGDRYLKICLYVLLANSLITNTALVNLTIPGITTSLRVLLFILLNGIVLTTAVYALFLNDIIEQTKNDGQIDPLSGAYNRRLFSELTAKPEALNFGCVVMCDIDNFKRINDLYGHGIGDQVIRKFCHLLQSALRPDDLVIRLGGEEFLLVLRQTDLIQANMVANRICHQTSKQVIELSTQSLCFTASFGVTQIDDEGLEKAVQRADVLLYQAKNKGKNQVMADLSAPITFSSHFA
ncbi:GGDEF domain-containing protein [Rheinheimera sp.]|uniref:GGDEF domain-containing protein n=1 Tax=Rheinheimera sp. TaxID=1869214 RepID=UPI002FDE4BCC